MELKKQTVEQVCRALGCILALTIIVLSIFIWAFGEHMPVFMNCAFLCGFVENAAWGGYALLHKKKRAVAYFAAGIVFLVAAITMVL